MKDKAAGLFLLTRKNDYQRLQETAAVAMARRLKVPLEVKFAENDVRTQTQQIYAFIHEHPIGSAVVVEAVSDGPLEQVARHAALAGMGWLLLNRTVNYMNELRIEFSTLPIGVVTADQKEIGRLQGKQFDAILHGKGTVLYVSGPAGASAASDRLAGMKETIEGTAVKFHLVYGDWTEDGGQKAVTGFFRNSGATANAQLVGCQNDAMAAGALRALSIAAGFNRPDLSQIPVTGVDGNPEYGIPLVDRQRLAATIVMPAVAGQGIELIHKAWTTPGFAPPPVVRLPVRSYPEIGSVTLRAAR